MIWMFAGARVLGDYTVWDNNGAYALVTFVSLAFTAVLIVTVVRQSRAHEARRAALRELAATTPETAPQEQESGV